MKKKLLILSISFIFNALTTFSQVSTDLWTVKTKGSGMGLEIIEESARKLTDRPFYDNQPSFINEYQLVFSAADEENNFDIIVYNFENEKFTNLSKTSDRNENSPRITDCGQYISAVVSEPDGKQRLWLYPTNFEPAELLYDDIEPVGYYDWYNNKAAMFILGEPNQLVYAQGREDILTIDENIARSIQKRPKTSEITYLSQTEMKVIGDLNALVLMSYDIKTGEKNELGIGLAGSQDFIWVDKKNIIMAYGENIYIRNISNESWKLLAKLPTETHQNISRLAYSKDLNILVYAIERK